MRKGTVFIFTGVYPSDYYLNYLARELPKLNKRIIKAHRVININGYNIRLMKYPDYRVRGYRPEFIYYIGGTSVINYNGGIVNYNEAKRQIEWDTKYKSTRKEPIRYINYEKDIDLRELLDDDYSLLQCDFWKLKYKDKFIYIWLKVRNKFRKENKLK